MVFFVCMFCDFAVEFSFIISVGGRLNSGKTFDVITRILKSLIGKSVIVPGDFKSVKNQYGITCSYRAQSGHLYPLNRSFLFIVKPVIFVRWVWGICSSIALQTAAFREPP